MLISTKGRYALRIMLDLAQQSADLKTPLPAIAARQEISEKYLESIVSTLAKAGFVEGRRGKGGGYRLARAAEDYSVGEILRAAEGSLAPVACLGRDAAPCPRAKDCRTLPVWEKLEFLIGDYLDGVPLTELLGDTAGCGCPGK